MIEELLELLKRISKNEKEYLQICLFLTLWEKVIINLIFIEEDF